MMMQPLRSYQCSSCVGCAAASSSGHCSNRDDERGSCGGRGACGAWAPR